MATAGLYELSGDWLYEIGMPGKSGVSGGIVTVSPGKGGLATFSPPLDAAGNSVRGQLVTKYLAERLGLNLFASEAAARGLTPATRRRRSPAAGAYGDHPGGLVRPPRRAAACSEADQGRKDSAEAWSQNAWNRACAVPSRNCPGCTKS